MTSGIQGIYWRDRRRYHKELQSPERGKRTCVAVGMGDANYFSRMFRKVEGSSPSEYRKQW